MYDSVVHTAAGELFEYLPSLPEPMSLSCLVALDENRLIITGNQIGDGDSVYMFDRSAGEWAQIASLQNGRRQNGCGVVRDADGIAREVVVAGGLPYMTSAKF